MGEKKEKEEEEKTGSGLIVPFDEKLFKRFSAVINFLQWRQIGRHVGANCMSRTYRSLAVSLPLINDAKTQEEKKTPLIPPPYKSSLYY